MSNESAATADESDEPGAADDETVRAAELEVLREENQRLREEFAAAKRTQYRQTSFALVGVGLLAGVAGLLFPDARDVLLALGGTGVFVGVLTYYLTPEQFLPASVGRDVYGTLAENEAALVSELGVSGDPVYVPLEDSRDSVRLFVPQHADHALPDAASLEDIFVVTDRERERGVSFRPAGAKLFAEFRRALTSELGEDASTVVPQLTDALVQQFELVESVQTDIDAAGGRVTFAVSGSIYGPLDQFDHPVVSVLAIGLATGLDEPITVETDDSGDERGDYLVTCRWDAKAVET